MTGGGGHSTDTSCGTRVGVMENTHLSYLVGRLLSEPRTLSLNETGDFTLVFSMSLGQGST